MGKFAACEPFCGWTMLTSGENAISMNLARREMAIVLGTMFRRYDLYRGQAGRTLELYETERARDIDAVSDMIIPVPAKGSRGLQIRVRH